MRTLGVLMEIQSAFNSGLQGFQNAVDTANKASADIVASTTYAQDSVEQLESSAPTTTPTTEDVPNLNQSIVDLKVAEHQAKSSAEVIQTADETLGTLLDVRV